MIKIDNQLIQTEAFGDGTLKCKELIFERDKSFVNINISEKEHRV